MKILIAVTLSMFLATTVSADIRCCETPQRYKDGRLKRSASVLEAFKILYPLPAGFNRADYQIDHAVPLACGGRDIVENLLWMHKKAKTCAGDYCQDRIEMQVMCGINAK